MHHPSAAAIHALVEAVDASDMHLVLQRVGEKSDVLVGVDAQAMAQALLALLKQAADANVQAERVALKLTRREREVAGLLVVGMSNANMALELGCTERTVRAHLENMQRKTGAANRTALLSVVRGLNIGFSANIGGGNIR
ncbi:helix-turn-helix transcriptional regulator [Chromobacterium alkanivorans]|uniref:helix-turn-helix domain-containing protein n=1 Tax=Chromobacterium alkanivorans TaxID=1071719 RepID=UPI001967BD7F|nr:helix-turn-helix transcriptional regulator [Chromobacterium alkanivorans]MBN3005590.1 helix-turn-helix transcriptional regulator [Chromobacterium alkanivorans]